MNLERDVEGQKLESVRGFENSRSLEWSNSWSKGC